MKTVALFGGSFDPPHYGHINVAVDVSETLGIPVWMVPAYKHAWGKPLAPWEHRIAMCKLAARGQRNIQVVDFEVDNPNGLTYDMLAIASARHPDIDFKLVVGEDTAKLIKDKWARGQEVIEKHSIIVLPRPGYERFMDVWYRKAPHVYLQNAITFDGSSTEFRENYDLKKEINLLARSLVHPLVFQYVQDHNLYVPTS